MATNDTVPLFVVTGQQESIDLTPTGTYQNGVRVSFRTRSGALGSIFVPNDQYQPARVADLIRERATDMETVHNLVGEA